MRKLNLNKTTIQTLSKDQMLQVDGGLCLLSCKSGSRKGKACCGNDEPRLGPSVYWDYDRPRTSVPI